MKLLVHLFLMRLFPAFIVVNASALLGLNYVFPDPDSRFIALVVWCTVTMPCRYCRKLNEQTSSPPLSVVEKARKLVTATVEK